MSAITPCGLMSHKSLSSPRSNGLWSSSSQNCSAYVVATASYPALTRLSVMSGMSCERVAQRVGNRPLRPVVGGHHDVDVLTTDGGLLFGVFVASQHGEPERETGRPDAVALHGDPHRVTPPNPCDIVDLAVHDLDVVP